MKSKPALLLGCFLLTTGCIEFSRQTMSYRYDTAADTLYIFQDYQGIFGANNADQLDQEESDQLDSVMKGGRTFFFNNWITEFNRANLEETLNKPKGEIDANEEYEQAIRDVAKLALADVRVENVGFYKNKEGQLCGAQRVTVRQCSKIVAALNKLMPYAFREQAGEDGKSDQEKKAYLHFAASGARFIAFDGNQLQVRFPLSESDREQFQNGSQAKGIRASGGSVAYEDNMVVIKLGDRDAKMVSLALPFSEKPYAPNALANAKRFGIRKTFDPRSAAAEFLAGIPPDKH